MYNLSHRQRYSTNRKKPHEAVAVISPRETEKGGSNAPKTGSGSRKTGRGSQKSGGAPAAKKLPGTAKPPVLRGVEEIQDMLADYFPVERDMWNKVPAGNQIRYVKVGPGPRESRFKGGGFVKSRYMKENKDYFLVENFPYGKVGDHGYIMFTLDVSTVEELWKKIAPAAFIEVKLLVASLDKSNAQVAELNKKVAELSAKVAKLEAGVTY